MKRLTLKQMKRALIAVVVALSGLAAAAQVLTTYQQRPENADGVAVQDARGRWQELTGQAGQYTLPAGPLQAVAVLCFPGPRVTIYRVPDALLRQIMHPCRGNLSWDEVKALTPTRELGGQVTGELLEVSDDYSDQLNAQVQIGTAARPVSTRNAEPATFWLDAPLDAKEIIVLQQVQGTPATLRGLRRTIDVQRAPQKQTLDLRDDDSFELLFKPLPFLERDNISERTHLVTTAGDLVELQQVSQAKTGGVAYPPLKPGERLIYQAYLSGDDQYDLDVLVAVSAGQEWGKIATPPLPAAPSLAGSAAQGYRFSGALTWPADTRFSFFTLQGENGGWLTLIQSPHSQATLQAVPLAGWPKLPQQAKGSRGLCGGQGEVGFLLEYCVQSLILSKSEFARRVPLPFHAWRTEASIPPSPWQQASR